MPSEDEDKNKKIVLRSGKVLRDVPLKEMPLNGKNGFLNLRGDSSKTNSTVWFAPDFIEKTGLNAKRLEEQHNKHVKGHRPIRKIVRQSPGGRPLDVETPGGSVHTRTTDFGFCVYFDSKNVANQVKHGPITDIASPIKRDPVLRNVKTPIKKRKHKKINVTTQLLEQVAKEHKLNNKRRKKDQQATLKREGCPKHKASANLLADAQGLSVPGEEWEWLHLIAYMILGSKGQTPENLTAGTFHANTEMIFAEDLVKDLVTKFANLYPNGIALEVEAEEIPDTHTGIYIKYSIITDDFVLPFVFNAQSKIRPNLRNKDYLKNLVDVLVDTTKERLKKEADETEDEAGPTNTKSPDVKYNSSSAFFARNKKMEINSCKRRISFGENKEEVDSEQERRSAKRGRHGL